MSVPARPAPLFADIDDVARVLLFQWNALAKEEFEPPKASARNSAQFGALL